jgi:transposase
MKKFSLGVDLSARDFVVALWFDAKRQLKEAFPNTLVGFRQLGRWLARHNVGSVRVGLECTNTYHQSLALWLHEQGHEVYLLNPERTSLYARALGQGNKTDPADAVTIATYVALHELSQWTPPPPEQIELLALTRVRADLLTQRQQLANQLRTAHLVAQPFLNAAIKAIDAQIAAIIQQLKALLRAYPHLDKKVRRVMTIKGIGWLTAVIAIAELPPIDEHTDARTICAWAGLVPRRWQSGKTELPARLSRKGNHHLRNALFMPALVAKRHNPLLCSFAQSLQQRGKRPGAIIGAVSHKLLRIIVGVLKSDSDFDPNWAFN